MLSKVLFNQPIRMVVIATSHTCVLCVLLYFWTLFQSLTAIMLEERLAALVLELARAANFEKLEGLRGVRLETKHILGDEASIISRRGAGTGPQRVVEQKPTWPLSQ